MSSGAGHDDAGAAVAFAAEPSAAARDCLIEVCSASARALVTPVTIRASISGHHARTEFQSASAGPGALCRRVITRNFEELSWA